MSVGHCDAGLGSSLPPTVPISVKRPLQRLAAARKLQGISRHAMARRLNIDLGELQQQENEAADVPVSVLYAWQDALEVPAAELLAEASDSLSLPILRRSQLLRLMKTVSSIGQQTRQESIRRMVQTMTEQLVEIMPELAEVSPWHVVGKRRRLTELGVAADRRLSDDVFLCSGD